MSLKMNEPCNAIYEKLERMDRKLCSLLVAVDKLVERFNAHLSDDVVHYKPDYERMFDLESEVPDYFKGG